MAYLRRRYWVRWGCASANAFLATWDPVAKPRPQVAQSDPVKVAAFKKTVPLARRRGVELWSVDECRFQQHGTRCHMWVPPEIKDPVGLHAPTRKSVACTGAVSVRTGKFIHSLCAMFNAATFETFLKTLL